MSYSTIDFRVLGIFLLCCLTPTLESYGHATQLSYPIDLATQHFKFITFENIPPTRYLNDGMVLKMSVDKSASFLLQSFPQKVVLTSVSFEWKSSGHLAIKSSDLERTRQGDDAFLRIGLLISGPKPIVPFFVPGWIKKVQKYLNLPSDRMLYLTVGTLNPPGTKWQSPYSSSIEIIALGDSPLEGGWRRVHFKHTKPLDVVGLWIMADGDNTLATFTTYLRNLTLF